MTIYATYYECDPLMSHSIQYTEQLLPYFIDEVNELPELSFAIIYRLTLNIFIIELNTIMCIVNENISKIFLITKTKTQEAIMRLTSIVIGILAIFFIILFTNNSATILEMTFSIPLTFIGCTLGIFTIASIFPWIGKRATFYGAVAAILMIIYYVIMTEIDSHKYRRKLTSVAKCSMSFSQQINATHDNGINNDDNDDNYISYLYYMPSCALLTCINSYILSFIFGFKSIYDVNPNYLAPFMRKYLEFNHIDSSGSSSNNSNDTNLILTEDDGDGEEDQEEVSCQ
jgi:hypothetical protein